VSRHLCRRPLLSSRLFIRAGRTEPDGGGELFPNLFFGAQPISMPRSGPGPLSVEDDHTACLSPIGGR
jgi:hypothetical protein